MKKSLLIPIICSCLIAFPAFAQSTDPGEISNETAVENTNSLFQKALNATPPQRFDFANKVFNSKEAIQELDEWIENAGNDNPQSLIVKDLLTAMPPQFAGPRIVKLAKKSSDPAAQKNWSRWLSKYPDAYSAVIHEWLVLSKTQPSHFLDLLSQYAEIQPQAAMNVWVELIKNNKILSLHQVGEFGYHQSLCADQLIHSLTTTTDDTQKLRIQRAFIRCQHPVSATANPDELKNLQNIIADELNRETISVRLVALSLLASNTIPPQFVSLFQDKLINTYDHAKNSTERAMALLALNQIQAPGQKDRLADMLKNGDETMRFQVADILSCADTPILSENDVKLAFQKELWPDTQQKLYETLAKLMSGQERVQFQKQIISDSERPLNMRISAIDDLFASAPDAYKLNDMAGLQKSEAPVELIASAAEHLYAHDPGARPKLREWIAAQQPFERRLLSTFALFVKTDEFNHDDSSLDTMRSICSKATEQHSILQPCLHYMSSHAQSDADKELLETLQKRRNQIDAMTGFEL